MHTLCQNTASDHACALPQHHPLPCMHSLCENTTSPYCACIQLLRTPLPPTMHAYTYSARTLPPPIMHACTLPGTPAPTHQLHNIMQSDQKMVSLTALQLFPQVIVLAIAKASKYFYTLLAAITITPSLTKACPWAERLISLPKRGVGALSSVSAKEHSRVP